MVFIHKPCGQFNSDPLIFSVLLDFETKITMTDKLKSDITYVRSSPSELESYLLSTDVIRQLPAITLSAGGILLAHKRLVAAGMIEDINDDWSRIEDIRNAWKVAWTNKCRSEFKMRLRLWGDFILGMAPDKNEPSTAYSHQVRNRAILQLFQDNLPDMAVEFNESLERKDKILLKFSVENGFIWEDEIKDGFPEDKYWFLYRLMRYEKEKSN